MSNKNEEPLPGVSPQTPSGDLLGGSHQTPLGRLKCLECGFINVVAFIDEDNLPACQNPEKPPHILRLDDTLYTILCMKDKKSDKSEGSIDGRSRNIFRI